MVKGKTFLMEEQHKSRLPGYSLACTSGDWRAQQEQITYKLLDQVKKLGSYPVGSAHEALPTHFMQGSNVVQLSFWIDHSGSCGEGRFSEDKISQREIDERLS